jgi:hypothetical protein
MKCVYSAYMPYTVYVFEVTHHVIAKIRTSDSTHSSYQVDIPATYLKNASTVTTSLFMTHRTSSTIAFHYTMTMMNSLLLATVALLSCATGNAFQTMVPNTAATCRTQAPLSTALHMANDEDFKRWDKASRSAQDGDNVVTMRKPLGLVLNSDDEGNVYVETVAPKGNAARTGMVRIDGEL